MPARPFTRRQALQNAAFLEGLRQTGNPRLAARLLGVHRSTYTKRRAKSAAFAQQWDAALAAAHAAFHEAGGPRPPQGTVPGDCPHPRTKGGLARRKSANLRTEGGELFVGRTRGGRLQLRRAPPGWMTKAGEQAFFFALSATANVRLSAAAAGFSHTAFYAKAKVRIAFAREMRLALATGYDRVEGATLAAGLPGNHEDDGWRHNDPPPIPPLTPDQAIQLLALHEKSVRQSWEQPHRRKRRHEPWETYTERLRAMWTAEKRREAEDEALRRAARAEPPGDWCLPEEPRIVLPPLHLVTGWSKAKPQVSSAISAANTDGARRPTGREASPIACPGPDPGSRHDGALTEKPSVPESGPVYNPDLALFGGWRLRDWEKRKKAGG